MGCIASFIGKHQSTFSPCLHVIWQFCVGVDYLNSTPFLWSPLDLNEQEGSSPRVSCGLLGNWKECVVFTWHSTINRCIQMHEGLQHPIMSEWWHLLGTRGKTTEMPVSVESTTLALSDCWLSSLMPGWRCLPSRCPAEFTGDKCQYPVSNPSQRPRVTQPAAQSNPDDSIGRCCVVWHNVCFSVVCCWDRGVVVVWVFVVVV